MSKEGEREIAELQRKRLYTTRSEIRVKFFENNFLGFFLYYFEKYATFDTPDYLKLLSYSLQDGKHSFCAGFTGSGKTTLVQAFVIRKAVYKKARFVAWYSNVIDDAVNNLTDISNEFISNKRLIQDFGQLYFSEQINKKNGRKEPKRTSKFTLTNGCFFQGFSLSKSARGRAQNTEEERSRPDLMIFDDVENAITLQSKVVTKKNWIALMEARARITNGQIVFLGNVIKDRGLVMWMFATAMGSDNRAVHRIPIYDNMGNIVFAKFVETEAEAKVLNSTIEKISHHVISLERIQKDLEDPIENRNTYEQEYLLQPATDGDSIFLPENIRYKGFDSTKSTGDIIYMGIDPAESEKDASDPIGIVIAIRKKYVAGYKKHIVFNRRVVGKDKNTKIVGQIISNLYKEYDVDICRYENKAGGITLANYIQEKYSIPFELINPHTDKVTRAKKEVPQFVKGDIIFNPHMSIELKKEALSFPNALNDDLVDAMVYAITGKPKTGASTIQAAVSSRRSVSILDKYKNQ